MCKFCEIEPGDTKDIEELKYETALNGKVVDEESLVQSLYVDDNDVPTYYIVTAYWDGSGRCKGAIETPIKYCPFCGRKLHND